MDAYHLAIEQARQELAEAQLRLKSLTLRVSQLEAVVTQLEALTAPKTASPDASQLGIAALNSAPPLSLVAPSAHQSDIQPLWKAIINALNGKKSDFTVPDALAALERTGRHINSPNRLNIVRNTLIQNKAFRRIKQGHYCVLGYEAFTHSNDEGASSV